MASLARGRLRKKIDGLIPALRGKVEAHHRFMLEMQLDRVEDIEANIAVVDHKIDDAICRGKRTTKTISKEVAQECKRRIKGLTPCQFKPSQMLPGYRYPPER